MTHSRFQVGRLTLILSTLAAALLSHSAQSTEPTRVRWLGHAAFRIETPKGRVLLIDPWLGNPMNPEVQAKRDPLASLKRVDYLLVTHGHFDHVGEAVVIAKRTKARLVASFELGTNLVRALGFPEGQVGFDTLMNPGGEISLADGEIRVAMVPAIHSSSLDVGPGKPVIYGGNPVGLVLKIQNGPTLYHSGDTAYFKDMELIGDQHAPDLALLNIGGHFGMEPVQAAQAARAVKAKWVVAHHYKTFPILTQDVSAFRDALPAGLKGALGAGPKFVPMNAGETIEFKGRDLIQREKNAEAPAASVTATSAP